MKKIAFSVILFVVTLFIGEQFLKKRVQVGYQTHYSGFTIVDSLIVYNDYTTDSMGNYILSPLLTDTLKTAYNFENCSIDNTSISSKIANVDGVKQVLYDFCTLKNLTEGNNEFEQFALNLHAQDSFSQSDSAYLAYLKYPFNSSGFRSIEFKNTESDKIKVLIIGDSFVWGMSAYPIYNSFVDVLSARDYEMYNAGITSVDPIQYLQICKQYVSVIQPDLVIVNFYEDNDILSANRIHQNGFPHEYITNAGFFESNPEGKHLGPQEAYDYYKNAISIPKNSLFNRFLSKTAIGSILWTTFHIKKRYEPSSPLDVEEQVSLTKSYMQQINATLEASNTPFFYCITPKSLQNKGTGFGGYSSRMEEISKIFLNLEYYIPSHLVFEDYNEPLDFHFNNSGSLKYANFIDSLIQKKLNIE